MEALRQPRVEWGVASRPLGGQSSSGDAYVAHDFADGFLAAVIDGLGHGDEAASAAKICVDIFERHAHEAVERLVSRCHERLLGTRGATMSVVSFDATTRQLSWLGVGNVEAHIWNAGHRPATLRSLLLRNGVVGLSLPRLQASATRWTSGDTLILATDGIREGFAEEATESDSPQRVADAIMAKYGKASDDALVLVARFRESAR